MLIKEASGFRLIRNIFIGANYAARNQTYECSRDYNRPCHAEFISASHQKDNKYN